MTTNLTEVMKSYVMNKLSTEVQKKKNLQLTKTDVEKEIIALADKLVEDMLPQLQQTDQWIARSASEFASHISKLESYKSIVPHQPVVTNEEQDIIDWINEVARSAANTLKAEYQQGYIQKEDLTSLIGKIKAYQVSTLESLHMSGLSDERKEKLVKKLLDKYQQSVEETVQRLHQHADTVKKQTEEPVKRKKLFGIF